jgi:hypothetical protein
MASGACPRYASSRLNSSADSSTPNSRAVVERDGRTVTTAGHSPAAAVQPLP